MGYYLVVPECLLQGITCDFNVVVTVCVCCAICNKIGQKHEVHYKNMPKCPERAIAYGQSKDFFLHA